MSLQAAFADQRHPSYGSISTVAQKRADDGPEAQEEDGVLEENHTRRIGVSSAIFMVVNRMVGAAIFITPSIILAQCGSVGLSLLLWIIGGAFSLLGMQVYVVWGMAFPQNGAEQNYLEYLFPRPKGLAIAVFAVYSTILGYTAGNCIAFARYLFRALHISTNNTSPSSSSGTEDSQSLPLKLTAFACITFAMLVHGLLPAFGIKLQSILGMLKVTVLAIVIGSGMIAFIRGPLDDQDVITGRNRNFENIWEGTTRSPSQFCLALFSALWGFGGFNHINYALSEVKSPKKTLRIAGPMAVTIVACLYLCANLAYLVAVPKEEIIGSTKRKDGQSGGAQLVAALLFQHVYGKGKTERMLDGFVAMCAFGNVLSVMYAQALAIQHLGKSGFLPASKFWASKYPVGAPLAGASLHWLACLPVIFGVSHKDAYQFVINVKSYPGSMLSVVMGFGLIYASRARTLTENSPIPKLSTYNFMAALVFGLSNVFLIVVPFIPPPPGREPYQSLPYWAHILGGWMVLGIGVAWWAIWRRTMR